MAEQSAVGRYVLVLLADRLLQAHHLDLDRFAGQQLRVGEHSLVGQNAVDQADQKAARGTQTRACRDVRHADDFQRGRHIIDEKHLTDETVLDLRDILGLLRFRVLEEVAGQETLVDRDVDVLIDGRRDDETAVLRVVGGQVRAAAADGDTQGSASDDQCVVPCPKPLTQPSDRMAPISSFVSARPECEPTS